MPSVKSGFAKFMEIFGYCMVVVYVGMGVFLLVPNKLKVPVNIQIAVGLFFISYGIYRLTKIISKHRENQAEEE